MTAAPTHAASVAVSDAAAFVMHEARLLDAKRFDEWYELFDADGRYWMPLARGQQDRRTHTSLLDEDRFMLKIRIERLKHARAAAQQPPSFCHHLLQAPWVERVDDAAGRIWLRTEFNYTEVRARDRFSLAGTAHHELVQRDAGWRIVMKRIDLLECEMPLPSIQLFV